MGIRALVVSGAVFMTIPEHVAVQLGFDIEQVSTRVLADGSRKSVPMERMDLVLLPEPRRLAVNPESPFIPVALAK